MKDRGFGCLYTFFREVGVEIGLVFLWFRVKFLGIDVCIGYWEVVVFFKMVSRERGRYGVSMVFIVLVFVVFIIYLGFF